jgi:hypothetical protein
MGTTRPPFAAESIQSGQSFIISRRSLGILPDCRPPARHCAREVDPIGRPSGPVRSGASHSGAAARANVGLRHRHLQAAARALLTAGQDGFLDEARDVLRARLSSGPWITVAIPALATRPRMAAARRSAMNTSPGSAPRIRRAATTFSNCCSPDALGGAARG